MSDNDFDDEEGGGSSSGELGYPAPRENPELVGHEAAEANFLGAFNSGRLPHAWLIVGARGIGKATLAYRMARFLLAQPAADGGLFGGGPPQAKTLALSPEHPAFRLVVSCAHPDLLTIERSWNPKTKKLRSEIAVDDTRSIATFLHLTPSQGAWRVVVVDGADDMNRNAANALLKVLEEPPPRAMLILTSESAGRLLPTIRSRCRIIHLNSLPDDVVLKAIRKYAPDYVGDEAMALARLADGSIGRALQLAAADGLSIHQTVFELLGQTSRMSGEALHAFAEKLARGDGEGFRLFTELLPNALAALAKLALGAIPAGPAASEREVLARLAPRRSPAQWVELWQKICHLFAAADGIDLDKKAVVLNAFFAIDEAAR